MTADDAEKPYCGIVRPIAAMGDYTAGHWAEVHAILADAVASAGHRARLVSESEASRIILGNVVSNLYHDPIVICDVSGRNPNVMFELGMRVAFEKPVVVVADHETPFSFDIAPFKHIVYPRTLRYQAMIDFQAEVAAAIPATLEAGWGGGEGYLQQFGRIQVAEIKDRKFTPDQIAEDIEYIKRMVQGLAASPRVSAGVSALTSQSVFGINFTVALGMDGDHRKDGFEAEIRRRLPNATIRIERDKRGGTHAVVQPNTASVAESIAVQNEVPTILAILRSRRGSQTA